MADGVDGGDAGDGGDGGDGVKGDGTGVAGVGAEVAGAVVGASGVGPDAHWHKPSMLQGHHDWPLLAHGAQAASCAFWALPGIAMQVLHLPHPSPPSLANEVGARVGDGVGRVVGGGVGTGVGDGVGAVVPGTSAEPTQRHALA
jgi:hypothetical protein